MSANKSKNRRVLRNKLPEAQIFEEKYHLRQFEKPYRSTIKFCDFLEKMDLFSDCKSIIDIGAGAGANVYYMAKRFPRTQFVGLDINKKLVEVGKRKLKKIENAEMIWGSLYELDSELNGRFDGVVSYQTLSWLKHYREPIEVMTGLGSKWVALTSLFYDGPIDFIIEVRDHSKPDANKPFRKNYYNIYSLQMVKELFRKNNYFRFIYEPFEIDIDLDPPLKGTMGTYTKKLDDGRRIQISGALLMPWYFVLASKAEHSNKL